MKPALSVLAALCCLVPAVPSLRAAEEADHPAPAADAALPAGSLYDLKATWTSQRNEPVEWEKSTGTVRVVAMGYATCKAVCPRMIADMQRIEKDLTTAERDRCRFTFVTVNPEFDKVPQLQALADRHKLDSARWDLLTGKPDNVLELAVALGVRFNRLPDGTEFAHSYLIAVVGPDGRLLHKWVNPAQGPAPSVRAIRSALAEP